MKSKAKKLKLRISWNSHETFVFTVLTWKHFLTQNMKNLVFEIVPFQNTQFQNESLGCSYLLGILFCGTVPWD